MTLYLYCSECGREYPYYTEQTKCDDCDRILQIKYR
jgi:hypothetical protein